MIARADSKLCAICNTPYVNKWIQRTLIRIVDETTLVNAQDCIAEATCL